MVTIKAKHYNKWDRLAEAKRVLEESNIKFEIFNGGVHYIITADIGIINYWPTTGKWLSSENSWTESTRFLQGILSLLQIEYKEEQ